MRINLCSIFCILACGNSSFQYIAFLGVCSKKSIFYILGCFFLYFACRSLSMVQQYKIMLFFHSICLSCDAEWTDFCSPKGCTVYLNFCKYCNSTRNFFFCKNKRLISKFEQWRTVNPVGAHPRRLIFTLVLLERTQTSEQKYNNSISNISCYVNGVQWQTPHRI